MKRLVVGISVALGCAAALAGAGCRVGEFAAQEPGPHASLVQACAQSEGVRLAVSVRTHQPREDLGAYIFRAEKEGAWQLDSLTRGRRRWFFDGGQYLYSDSVHREPVAWEAESLTAFTEVLSLCRSGFDGAVWSSADPWEDGFPDTRPAAQTEWMKVVVAPLAAPDTIPEVYIEFASLGHPVTMVLKRDNVWIELDIREFDLGVVDPFPDFGASYPSAGPTDRGPYGFSCVNRLRI
ncbi:MAG: hypothetical protein ACI9VR_001156 [Cognaticolwellia sp.]|jgi:hypothetical protein